MAKDSSAVPLFPPDDLRLALAEADAALAAAFRQTRLWVTWREFLWQHLVGDVYPMADLILDRFARDESLGLVFPNDPQLVDWDGNLEIATDLARRMGMRLPLPRFFEFPVGTMFWARPKALRSLFDLGLQWEDYPKEPLRYDGTMLHAIERLLPLVAQHAGFGFATTYVPGVTW